MDTKHPYEALLKEWEHWAFVARTEEVQHKPAVTMMDLDAPPNYKAQLCVRKNPDKSRPKYLDYIARGVIINTKTNSVALDTGGWVKPNEARKKLDLALIQLGSIQKP